VLVFIWTLLCCTSFYALGARFCLRKCSVLYKTARAATAAAVVVFCDDDDDDDDDDDSPKNKTTHDSSRSLSLF